LNMAQICGTTEGSFVERVASILPQGIKDSWRLSERQSLTQPPQGDADLIDESVTVPGVSYGEAGSGEETLKYTFAFHCPTLFRRIRARYGIRDEDFKQSLCSHRSIKGGVISSSESTIAADDSGGGGGSSGAVFFFSRDRKFALKELRAYEFDLLRRLLPDYLDHLEDDNSYTLLPRFFGLGCLRVEGKAPMFLQVTNNVFYVNRPLAVMYDLKGASHGRYVAEEGEDSHSSGGRGSEDLNSNGGEGRCNAKPLVLKEHNFSARGLVRESRGEYAYPERSHKLSVGPQMRENLLNQLDRDCAWLEEHNLVDYSLLVGVVTDMNTAASAASSASSTGTDSPSAPQPSGGVSARQAGQAGGSGSGSGHGHPNSAAYMSKIVVASSSSGKASDDRRCSWSLAAVHEYSDVGAMVFEDDEGKWQHSGVEPIALQGVGETYMLGLVDILQEYTCRKATECAAKQALASLRGGHPYCMSVVPAAAYAHRLKHYIGQNTE